MAIKTDLPRLSFDHNAGVSDRSFVLKQGTIDDLARLGLTPEAALGMRFAFVNEDTGPSGEPDALVFNGTIARDGSGYLLLVDSDGVQWQSERASQDVQRVDRAKAAPRHVSVLARGSREMVKESNSGRAIQTAMGVAIVWLVMAGLLVLQFWPHLPDSGPHWVLFIVFGPPVYVLVEGFFGWLLSPAHGREISAKRFSGARIGVALVVAIVLLVAVQVFVSLWR